MILKWKQGSRVLDVEGIEIPVSCRVRTLENGLRGRKEIVRTMPGGVPYQPALFPVGKWIVKAPMERVQPDRAPWYIGTDAFQELDAWEIEDGSYTVKGGEKVRDSDYGLHHSVYPYTLGCLKIERFADIEWLAGMVKAALEAGKLVYMEVEA